MFEEYGAMRAGGAVGPHSYRTEGAERGMVFLPYAGARIGYPHEEAERGMAFYGGAMGVRGMVEPHPSEEAEREMAFYGGAMGVRSMVEPHPSEEAEREMAFYGGAMGVRSMVEPHPSEEALLKEEYLPLERGLKFVPLLELFEKIKKERSLEDFEEVLYRRSEKIVEPFRELSEAKKEVIRKLVDINLEKYMVDRVETFKKKEESESLQPKDVLEIFSIKKIAGETGWGDMLTEIKKIEKGYYKDCSTIPEVFEKTLRSGKAMTVKEAEDMLNRIYEFAEKHNISFTSPLIKNQIKILEMEMDL
jgi:hypothetical protein